MALRREFVNKFCPAAEREKMQEYDILFAIMAVQEVVFFAPMARRLAEEEGLRVAFLTFHEAGDDILRKEGIPFFSLHKMKRRRQDRRRDTRTCLREIEAALAVSAEALVTHERLTANRSEKFVYNKLICYYTLIDRILRDNRIGCVVQELGGFIAPQLLFRLARRHGVDHVFIEPAMFPKRVVFTLNELYADIPAYDRQGTDSQLEPPVRQLVENYLQNQVVVIPKKDRHFFQDMGWRRLLSGDNFRRLGRKLYHKYILGREEEYNAILWYTVYHLKKLYRRRVIDSWYRAPVEGEKYIYFPFHVPLDVQLTVRCPEFLEQEALIEKIARVLPPGYKLYIKEHPAAVGGHDLQKLRRLTGLDNVRLLHSGTNSFRIIKNAACVITINSKVGFEAIMQGKPVVVLGKAFYRNKGVTVDSGEEPADIARAIEKALRTTVAREKRFYFINKAFAWSYPGELYENSRQNRENFYCSLRAFLKANAAVFQPHPSQPMRTARK